jgi:hypothetical protein
MRQRLWSVLGYLLLLTLVVGVTVPAHAGTILTLPFEELRMDNNAENLVGPLYSADGMTLTALPPPQAPGTMSDFFSVGTLSPSFTGSTSVYHHISTGEIVLTQTDGELFHLISLDLSELPSFDNRGPIDLGPFDVTFFGVRKNGKTVTATATVSRFPAVTTFTFHGFTNLASVLWFQGAGGARGLSTHQFDNIVVQIPGQPAH